MKIIQHRNIEGTIKTLTIKKEAGNYYAIFTTTKEATPPEIKDTNPVGIDLGLNNFIALSDGKTIQKPKFFKKKAKRIAKWQRIVARRTKWQGRKKAEKQSKRREDAKAHLSQEWANVTNQSNDFAHKLADHLINSGYTSFVVRNST
ncbi:Transposase (probable), IS891/IS1136/IS1341 domain protein [mine drainage metagenome]|uniref:Transposase (Probable), IS891/IS1136/IS1341 domain protein n=1 Tax=mine drainage metagenome TaxID=410659 RepID=T1BY57_9ZZZZ